MIYNRRTHTGNLEYRWRTHLPLGACRTCCKLLDHLLQAGCISSTQHEPCACSVEDPCTLYNTKKQPLSMVYSSKHWHITHISVYYLTATQLKWTAAYQCHLIFRKHLRVSWREEMSRRPTFPQSRAGPCDDHHCILHGSSWSEADKYPVKQQDPSTC